MSYIYNSDGVKSNNPINETNTNFDSNSISKQNMFTGEPISQYDTEYLNEYRSQIEQLRSRTESMNMALEAALVPSIVKGTSVYLKQIPGEVDKLRSYVFNDHLSQHGYREIVFKCDMVKFRSDRRKRLCYDRTIKMYTKKGDTIQSIIENVILEYVPTMTYEKFIDKNYDLHNKKANSVLQGGIEIDTCIPTTLYNLVKLRYVKPFLAFVNNLAISWDNTSISVDNNTTYVIINMKNGDLTYRPNIKDYPNTKFQYLDLPFQVDYIRAGDSITVTEGGVTKYKYDKSYLDKDPIFCFNSNMGGIVSNSHYNSLKSSYSWFANSDGYERIFTKDPFVIYQEFDLDSDSLTDGSISKLGLLYNKKLNDFGYMSKIKQFNMLCFEQVVSNDESHGGYIRDDFDVESHQFNILKIDLKTVDNKKRRFKVFYNTRVLYDQDNMLRLGSKNMPVLEAEFYAYMKDVSSNVQTFIDEIYKLQQKDIGIYEDNDGNEYTYNHELRKFTSLTTDRVVNLRSGPPVIIPNDLDLKLKNIPLGSDYYVNKSVDHYRIRQEILHMNNMEEGSTCDDEFLYYQNSETRTVLRELANQIFKEDEPIILQTIYDLIDRMYEANYNQLNSSVNRSVKNEWFIRKHLAEMFLYDLDEWYSLNDMGILDEVFDFTYKDTLSYKENLTNAVDYIVGYDADKLESTIHRGVVSITRTGSELQQFISNDILKMPTWGGFNKRDNYVMIFRNGILYSKYSTIEYEGDSFKVTMASGDCYNNDKFEFVFFLNVNNTVLKTTLGDNNIVGSYITSNSAGCNTSVFDPENVIGMIDKIPENEYNDYIDFSLNKTSYVLNNTIRYVEKISYEKDDGSIGIKSTLSFDSKSNGIYNISKQGGGDYLINFSYKDKSGKTIEVLNGTEVTLCSSRQFRYQRSYAGASASTFTITLNDDFKYVLSANNILVFKNGYVVPMNSVFIRPTNNTPIDKCKLYLDIAVSANDRIEIFYLPNSLEFMNSEVTNGSTRYNPNNEPIKRMSSTNYIRFTSPLYGVSSKHSLFVFLNGRKIPMSDMEDVSNTIIKITTNQTSYDRLEIYSHLDQDESNHKVFIKDGLDHNKTSDSIDFSTMDSYKEPSKLDKLINTSTDEKLNNFFGDASSTDTSTHIDQSFYSKESVIDRIKNDYILAGDPDAWIALIET